MGDRISLDRGECEHWTIERESKERSELGFPENNSRHGIFQIRGFRVMIWIQGIVIILLFATNTATLHLISRSQHDHERAPATASEHGSSPQHGYKLEFGKKLTTFTEAVTLSGTDARSREAWENLLATGGTNDNYGIERGILWTFFNATQGIPYSISMWHALHCLNMLHKRLFDAPEEWATYAATFSNKSFHTGHLPHCFGYLAQHILCAGDTILEKPDLIWGGKDGQDLMRFSVTGFGTPHTCRDLDQAMKIVKKIEGQSHPLPALQWQQRDTLEGVYGYLLR
jgi:hypothetical protein